MADRGWPEAAELKESEDFEILDRNLRGHLANLEEWARDLRKPLTSKLVDGLMAEGFDRSEAVGHASHVGAAVGRFADAVGEARKAVRAILAAFRLHYVFPILEKRAERGRAVDDDAVIVR